MLRQSSVVKLLIVCGMIVCLLLTGCGKKETDEGKPDSSSPSGQESMPAQRPTSDQTATPDTAAQGAQFFAQANQGKAVEPLSVETLKGFLPAALVGMERGEVDTDAVAVMQVKTTEAYADYAKTSGPGDMHLSITDVGNASGPIAMAMTGWVMTEVNNQSDTEYEKTTTFQGYKALEEYNNEGPSGTFTVVVANRFLVEVSGSRVTMETLKEAMGQVDLKKLAEAGK